MITFTPRTIEQIVEAINADKESRSALDPIDSTSDAGVYANMVQSQAATINLHESAFSGFAAEIEQRAREIPVGIPRWYAAESLLFQFGDALEYINGNVQYATVNTDNQIVKLAAADKENGFLLLKVAALNADGTARPLTNPELTAFRAYWGDKKFACVPISFISQAADIARLTYRIGVDATVIDPDTGQLLSDPTIYPVETAIISYLRSYQSTRFNSIFRVAELTDQIQQVAGVENAIAEDVQIKPNDGTFVDVIATPNDEYLARAGYIVHDNEQNFQLRDLLTYYNA